MDENIPIAITEGLRMRGVDVLTVQEDGLTSFPDPVVFDRAIELQRIVFSQDQDFLVEAKGFNKSRYWVSCVNPTYGRFAITD